MLGKALAACRKDVIIATKAGFRTGSPVTQAGLSKRHIQLEDNLKAIDLEPIFRNQ